MKKYLALVLLLMLGGASAVDCPFCHGKVVETCNVDIIPDEPIYGQVMKISVTRGMLRDFQPQVDEEVGIHYYNTSDHVRKVNVTTNEKGIAEYIPNKVGHHLVKACGKTILVYVNTTCGDGLCYGYENRSNCHQDCTECGDWICDPHEGPECPDCAECGDGLCTANEDRVSCPQDCHECGNGICEPRENRGSCPLDCDSGIAEGYCDGEYDDICDPDCDAESDLDCKILEHSQAFAGTIEERGPNPEPGMDWNSPIVYIPILIIAIAVLISILMFRKYTIRDERLIPPEVEKGIEEDVSRILKAKLNEKREELKRSEDKRKGHEEELKKIAAAKDGEGKAEAESELNRREEERLAEVKRKKEERRRMILAALKKEAEEKKRKREEVEKEAEEKAKKEEKVEKSRRRWGFAKNLLRKPGKEESKKEKSAKATAGAEGEVKEEPKEVKKKEKDWKRMQQRWAEEQRRKAKEEERKRAEEEKREKKAARKAKPKKVEEKAEEEPEEEAEKSAGEDVHQYVDDFLKDIKSRGD